METMKWGRTHLVVSHGRQTTQVSVHPVWLMADMGCHEDPSDSDELNAVQFGAFSQLMRTAGALDRAATDILADLGVTAGAFFALLELEAADDTGLAPSELARRLAVARRTATLYVDILLKHGWVSRTAHPEDRRMILARLTPAGHEVLTTIGVRYKEQLARLMDVLSVEQAEDLRDLLARVPLSSEITPSGMAADYAGAGAHLR